MTARANVLTSRATAASAVPRATEVSFAARDIGAFVDGLGRLGYDSEALLAATQLTRAELADPDGRISCERCGSLFGHAQRMRPTACLALRLAERMPIGAFPLVDYLVVTSDSVGDGLRRLAKYFQLAGGHLLFAFHENEDGDDDRVRVVLHGTVSFGVEFMLALGILHMRAETDGRFGVIEASITTPLDDAAEYARVLRCAVHDRAAWNGWLIARDMWRLPLRRRDSILRGVLESHANALIAALPPLDGIAFDVRRALATRIAGGDASIEAVARHLATAPRTLQRRLAAAGSSFQALVDQTRREAAERYLAASSLSIAEIGYLLGYSEPAAFHRAFKRWRRETPHAFRTRSATDSQ